MLQKFFKSQPDNTQDQSDLDAANVALQERMLDMLERDYLRKMRFATVDNTPNYLR